MKKVFFTFYYMIYHFIKNKVGEEDIPEYSTTVFISTLQLIFVLLTINTITVIIKCKTISLEATVLTIFLILTFNVFIFYVMGLQEKIIHGNWIRFKNSYIAISLTAAVPLLLLGYYIVSMIFMRNKLESCL